ncbi:MAG: hypothetical protein RBS84_02725 [Kiritimatiellia bacterium]|jgi:pyruvate/2-oxoglutarate dehydrogenase complex dihydrolipoamide acyltransferase (E2) component|nr:hypothetical protein [Kiritimatiellia bacterium]
MPDLPAIFLAVGDGSSVLEVVVWLVVGAVWLVSQVAANRKKREQAQRRNAARAEGSDPRPGSPSPAPDELAEIFKRLGADIPSTPPPRPRPAAPAPRPAPQRRSAPSKIQPNIARRLARAKAEAVKAQREVEAAWHIPPLTEIQGVATRQDDDQSVQAATRTSGLILPRLHAMDLRLLKFPSIPMPSLNQTQRRAPPLPISLHGHRALKHAIVAQALLHPPKSEFRM